MIQILDNKFKCEPGMKLGENSLLGEVVSYDADATKKLTMKILKVNHEYYERYVQVGDVITMTLIDDHKDLKTWIGDQETLRRTTSDLVLQWNGPWDNEDEHGNIKTDGKAFWLWDLCS